MPDEKDNSAARKRTASRGRDRTDKAPSVNRGRGIYFSDSEYEDLMDEVAAQIIENRRPVSISEVVRSFCAEGIERNRKRRGKEGESPKSHNGS